jgi:hypothetical protein
MGEESQARFAASREYRAHFLAALTLAQRALRAAAILLRPAADMVRFFPIALFSRR